jgi:phenylacetate-CoA ligase
MTEEDEKLSKIRRICKYAIDNSSFYRQTLREPQTWGEFHALPLLSAEQIRQHVNPEHKVDLLTSKPKGAVLFSTSASTGPRKLIYREYKEQARISRRLAMALCLAGITPEDSVANMFIPGNLAGAYMGMHEAIQRLGATVLPIGSAISNEEQSQLIHWLKPTALVGFPSTLIRLVEQGIPSVKTVLCGGEELNLQVRTDLETALGIQIPLVYANIECGIIGLQCEELHGSNQYHIMDEDLLVEIIDVATGKGSEQGELIVTHLHRRLQPVIRYRIGDLGQWVKAPCRCGRSNPRIELKGRASDERVTINGTTIEYSNIESVLSGLNSYLGRCQIRVTRQGSEDRATLYIEAEIMCKDIILAAINSQLPTVSKLLREGHLEAIIVQRGNIPTLPVQGGKVLRIVDER